MNYLTTDSELASVAEAIREKGGTSAALEYPQGFINAIRNIGPSVLQPKDVNFYDYDGTLLYSYTFTEANALASLPASPTRARLTFQEWNWTLAQIKSYISSVPGAIIDVGATYITTSGHTEVDITLTDILTIVFNLSVTNTNPRVSVDWGDGSPVETAASSGALYMQHTYAQPGSYMVSFQGGQFGFLCYSNVPFVTDVVQTRPTGVNERCSGIVRKIRIGNNYRWIGNGIRDLSKLESITVPKGCASPARFKLTRNSSLKCIVVPSDELTADGFDRNLNLEVVCLSPVMTAFASQFFSLDIKLKNVTIPSTVTSIGNYAFQQLNSVEKIVFPSSITSIPYGVFDSSSYLAMPALKQMVFLCSYSSLGNISTCMCNSFYNIERCVLPSGITKLATNHFNNCMYLEEITIPNTVTQIGSFVFSGCVRLEEITIPSGVASIDSSAFQNAGLRSVHMKPTTPPTCTSSIFSTSSLSEGFTIYVPYSADHSILNAYKTASIWSEVASYMQEEVA